jgi:replicative DNA helicase
MARKDGLGVLAEILRPEDFEGPAHQTIFATMLDLGERVEQVDSFVLLQALGNKLDQVGGRDYVHSLRDLWVHSSNLRQLAEGVRADAQTRAVKTLYATAEGKGYAGPELLAYLQDGLYQLDRQRKTGSGMNDGIDDLLYTTEYPPDASGFCSYPWRDLQWLTRGLEPGTLTFLAGQSGHGKTAAALAIGKHNVEQGKHVLLVSLEMTPRQLAIRTAQTSGYDPADYYAHRPNPTGAGILRKMLEKPYWQNYRLESVERVGQLYSLVRRHRPDLVIFDYLQLLDQEGLKQVDALARQTRGLKLLAQRYDVPVLCLSQLNRGGEDQAYNLDRLRGSGTIGNDADAVVFIERKQDKSTGKFEEMGKFYVAKSRMGVTGKMDFVFKGDEQRFIVEGRQHD